MPVLDDAAANKLLALAFKPATATAPTSYTLELWNGDPTEDGVEVDGTSNGYAPAGPVVAADWSTPAVRQISASFTFPAPTDAWTATHYVLRGDDGLGYDYGALDGDELPTGAGDPPVITVSPRYDELEG